MGREFGYFLSSFTFYLAGTLHMASTVKETLAEHVLALYHESKYVNPQN